MTSIAIQSAINNGVGLLKGERFYFGLLILPAFACLVFSYNYHTLWLIYDFIAMLLLIHFALSDIKIFSWIQIWVLVCTLGYFTIIVILNEHLLMGILSIWDTFKHLAYIPLITVINRLDSSNRNRQIFIIIYKFIGFAFVIQVLALAIQHSSGIFFDNIAGTFGDGGSHAIGFLSNLFIIASIASSKRWSFVLILIISSILMNAISENAGFYILLAILLVGVFALKKMNTKLVLIFIFVTIFSFFFFKLSFYSDKSFGVVIVSRTLEMFDIPSHFDPLENHGRNDYLFLASHIGNWFGQGPGAFSNIYGMEGYDIMNLIDDQINISEASHLMAESGYLGLLLTIVVYILFIAKLSKKLFVQIFMSFFFILCIFYTALLMNESHIFILLLIFYFLIIIESKTIKGNKYRVAHY